MEATELPPDVFRAFCASLNTCRIENDFLLSTAPTEQDPAEEDTTDEDILRDILLEFGPVMRRRDLWRIANGRGVESVSFGRLLSDSNIIVKHSRELYGLIGFAYAEPTEPANVNMDPPLEVAEAPAEDLRGEDVTEGASVLSKCTPESLQFSEQLLRNVYLASTRVSSSDTAWSLMDLGFSEIDFEILRRWINFGSVDDEVRERRIRLGANMFSGTEALALAFLAACCEVGRNSSAEGELWPCVEAEVGPALRKEFFANYANPKPRIRDATESVCSKLNIRHVFGREGEQSWFRSVFLQFGITRSGWKRLPLWLGGAKLPVAIEMLLSDKSGLKSASFASLWHTLQRLRWGEILVSKARQALAGSRWVTESEVNSFLEAAGERPGVLSSEAQNHDKPTADESNLVGAPLLTWRDEPRFELPLNSKARWLTELRYVLIIGTTRRLGIVKRGEQYVLDVPGETLYVDLTETVVNLDLQRRQVSCLDEPLQILLTPEGQDFAFYDARGMRMSYGEEKLVPGRGYLLLCRSSCVIACDSPATELRRVLTASGHCEPIEKASQSLLRSVRMEWRSGLFPISRKHRPWQFGDQGWNVRAAAGVSRLSSP